MIKKLITLLLSALLILIISGCISKNGSDITNGNYKVANNPINQTQNSKITTEQPPTPMQNNSDSDVSNPKYIQPNSYSSIANCDPIYGNKNAPLKILLVNVGDSPYFKEKTQDFMFNKIANTPPFKENFGRIAFYTIDIENTTDVNCNTAGAVSGSAGFGCNNVEVYGQISQKCKIDDTRGIITIVFAESESGGSGGEIVYIGSDKKRGLQAELDISHYVIIHEFGHEFGFGDYVIGTAYYDGHPNDDFPYLDSRHFLNLDGPGCKKWCKNYKPVSEYKNSLSSQCLSFKTKDECTSFMREGDKSCKDDPETMQPGCCVWSDDRFEYFDTNCAPFYGSENIGMDCLNNSGCYFGAEYSHFVWRPAAFYNESIMGNGRSYFSELEIAQLNKIFKCCLSPESTNADCADFRKEYSDLLGGNYLSKSRIGSCGYEIIETKNMIVSPDDDAVLGSPDAKVTLVEFSDFECRLCGVFARNTFPQIKANYIDSGKVKFVFRDFTVHPAAQIAAEASECVHEQGNEKYWLYNEKLFSNQASLDAASLKAYAKELGLDTTKFDACLDSGKYRSEVDKDTQDGESYGVSGIPTFFVNGNEIVGAQPYETFRQAIDSALNA